jgi:hypothetical protein
VEWTLNAPSEYMTLLILVHDSTQQLIGMDAVSFFRGEDRPYGKIPPDNYWMETFLQLPKWTYAGTTTITVYASTQPFSSKILNDPSAMIQTTITIT